MRFSPSLPLLLALILLLHLGCRSEEETEEYGPAPRFALLSSADTGLEFVNQLTEGPNTNILVYEYFYNGGGVATADFNGDDLPDLYFTSNMGDNRLYLNEGNLRFRDVTEMTGAGGRPGPWKTGVAIADVNADGLPDIYLSYSGMLPEDKRRNQLLIHQGLTTDGSPHFREAAAEYGLDLPAFTNQAYFFDYDADGDLDALLLNHNPKSLPILNVEKTRQLLAEPDPLRGLRLYRNDGGKFHDVTEAAGINGSALSYGLGLALSDVNGDGLTDFYVSNDYEVPDYLYLNNGDGTFTDRLGEQLGHTSHFSMGSDVADVNNDGLPDIFTLDMLPAGNRRRKLLMSDDNRSRHDLNLASGFHHQNMRNMLQLNRGDGSFAEIGQLAGVATTDWSWSALLTDLDNDGWKDLHVTNGYVRDYTNQDFIKYMDDFVAKKGRMQRSDVLELLKEMPASEVSNHVFRNTGSGTFGEVTRDWGLERPSNSTGAVTVDLDNDGDLDLVVNNINQPVFLYRNDTDAGDSSHYLQLKLRGSALNPYAIGAHVRLVTDSLAQTQELFPNRGYLSSGPTTLHFGLGAGTRVQRLTVKWPNGPVQTFEDLAVDTLLTLRQPESDAAPTTPPNRSRENTLYASADPPLAWTDREPVFRDFDRQALLPRSLSATGPVMATGYFNGDGRLDVIMGGGNGQASAVFLQDSGGGFTRTGTFAGSERAVTALGVHDFNGDGRPDLYVAAGGYHDLVADSPALTDGIYLNDGNGNFTLAPDRLPDLRVSTGAVAIHEANGSTEIFVGGRLVPGAYPRSPVSYMLRADARGTFSVAEEMSDLGMVTDAAWYDLGGDGTEELIVVGEWMPVRVFAREGAELVDRTERYFTGPTTGWWNVLRIADVTGDGRPDMIVGNEGDNNLYGVTPGTPASVLAADVNRDGSVDPLLFHYTEGRNHPDATRDELLGQLSGLRSTYTSYASYADADRDALAPHLGDDLPWLRAETLATTLFVQQPDGIFRTSPLPREAQFAPVHTITVVDADRNDVPDLLLCGNELRARLRSGPADANAGTLLLGQGDGRFTYVPQTRSGFSLRGGVRSVAVVDDWLLFGITGEAVVGYKRSVHAEK
ncbi:VCBS repeat-containing protein [Lewinella sp. JB7]|uniref:VCBS repeat-containing protein n=1 Tax=Lewinella sp. JB7 TaxID=2962887 RepID=UPI0020C9B37D|nr:VCBS repeat-containing protein [Lewinella sp. JB7]MCP9235213.1 VCBS repeat-containing protein [Lewinella sp. JB7]